MTGISFKNMLFSIIPEVLHNLKKNKIFHKILNEKII